MFADNHWSAALFLGGSLLLSSLAGTSAFGAVFEFAPFGRCVEASQLPPSTEAVGHLRSSAGQVKGGAYVTTDPQGRARFCFQTALIPGDRVRIAGGGTARQITIPVFSLIVNRVTDVVSGAAPPSTAIKIEAVSPYTLTELTRTVVANAAGRFSTDFTVDYDIRGSDRITASWRTVPQADLVIVSLRAPFMTVWYGSPSVLLTLNPNAFARVELRGSGGAVLATVDGRANPQGTMEERLWRNSAGDVVVTAAAQRVTATFASDASIVIPTLLLQADAPTDRVTGRCINGASTAYRIEIRGGPALSISRVGTTASDGTFSQDFTPFDLEPFDTVTVYCRYGNGDEIARSIVVVAP